jgi:hypothetical protein
MILLSGLENSAKKNIVSLLSREWPLSVKQIHLRLEKEGVSITYQAVHKAINELLNDKVLSKLGTTFQLGAEWIEYNQTFFGKIGKAYKDNVVNDLEKPLHMVFDNLLEFIKFLVNEYYFRYPNPESKSCACIWDFTYPTVFSSQKEIDNLKKFVKFAKHMSISRHDYPLDNIFSHFLEKFGKEAFCGIKMLVAADTFLNGDFICQAFFEEKFLKEWGRLYKKYPELNDQCLQDLFAFSSKPTEINVVIFKNASFADKIRNDCQKLIEKAELKQKR